MSPRKRTKLETISGASIRYDEASGSYRQGKSYVSFGQGESRVYDVGEAFLKKDILFEVLSEVRSSICVGNPRSISGSLSGKGIQVAWVLNRFDRRFIKRVDEFAMSKILKRLGGRCDSECLRGISYRNQYVDPVDVHVDGRALCEICRIMGQEPRDLYKRAADILNAKYRGHRSTGDSVIKVSSIPQDDLPVYMILVREKILRAQDLDGQEYLITKEVDDAEETLVSTLHELSQRFDSPEITVTNDAQDSGASSREVLIQEQLEACTIAMNNPVCYLCGFPGTGKTSVLCRILKESKGTVVLTPSHVSREVVCQRAIQNGVDLNTFSVEVLAYAVRHVGEWLPDYENNGEHPISQRSIDFMEKFKGEDQCLHIEILVIEEASMADVFQASRVIEQFCRIPSLKMVVFCGDHRQLQSVSKGRVLEDVMECGTIPGKILEVNHRSGSALSENLRHILKSSLINIEEDDSFEVVDSRIERCEVETDSFGRDRVMALQPIVDIFLKNMDAGLPTHVFGYMNVEVNKINEALKTAIFGHDSVMFPNHCKVRVKDPDLISPAHFHRKDFLEIVENKGSKHFVVKRWSNRIRKDLDSDLEHNIEIRVTGRLKEALALGYASSVHSFQGSECACVIIHGVSNCGYFSRDALYTAVSRGKKKCTIVTVRSNSKGWKKIVYKHAVGRLSNLSSRF
ncbi:unnamed protein product [Ectocarpus sp. CCAP 1310/34]|nr:unnamed protein product [Ectocarpus sp. CCAP 1310/34]